MKYVLFAILIGTGLLFYAAWVRHARRMYLDRFKFPDGLRRKLIEVRPELSSDQIDLLFDALREYFHVCRLAGKRFVSMPSQAVDEAWHAFILFTRSYDRFCRSAFGRFLHHTPAEAMSSPTKAQDGIKYAWRLACQREGIDPKSPRRLPLLFGIDAMLGIANGFRYQLQCNPGADASSYCASHIGCSSCGGGCSGDSGSDSGCGGGCGGD